MIQMLYQVIKMSCSTTKQMLEGLWAHPCAHVILRLFAYGLGTSQHTHGAWVALSVTHARTPLGNT
jgi:hypothetical protein